MATHDGEYTRLASGGSAPVLYRTRFYVLFVYCCLMFLYGARRPFSATIGFQVGMNPTRLPRPLPPRRHLPTLSPPSLRVPTLA
jgi:hypothetical protein